MDVERSYSPWGDYTTTINVHGTPEDTLFRVNQVGSFLGLSDMREYIIAFDFEDEEVRVMTCDKYTSLDERTYFTELGLTRLLGMCRKPKAWAFQKWISDLVREIRLTEKARNISGGETASASREAAPQSR